MDIEQLRIDWKKEEAIAHIHGWDFSYIYGRYEEENDLPWNYDTVVREYLKGDMMLLDYDTGGGEYLLSLQHPYANTSATEGYPPNVKLCYDTLTPLGINFRQCDNPSDIPFPHSNLREQRYAFEKAGFEILKADEAYRSIRFYDVGAFVWFSHIIEWEFPGFSVDRCFDYLLKMQKVIEETGKIEGTIHRYLIAAKKSANFSAATT